MVGKGFNDISFKDKYCFINDVTGKEILKLRWKAKTTRLIQQIMINGDKNKL